MTWRLNLRPASFRGAPFFADTVREEGGRRGPLHEYVRQDRPWFEDLGPRARQWSVVGYLLGPDYLPARDRLTAALAAEGPATLVLPTLGSRRAVCREYSVAETRQEGGFVRFELTFVQAGENRYPKGKADSRAGVRLAAGTALDELRTAFAAGFKIVGFAGWVLDAAAETVAEVAETVDALRGLLRLPAELAGQAVALVTDLEAAATKLVDDAVALVAGPPADLARSITGLVEAFRRAGGGDSVLATLAAAPALWPSPTGTTPARKQQAANAAAIGDLLRQAAVVERARQAPLDNYESRQAASVRRELVVAALDAEIVAVGDSVGDSAGSSVATDSVYEALTALRAAVVTDLGDRALSLPTIAAYRMPTPMPALALAWRLHQDPARDKDLALRNPVAHPGVMPVEGEFLAS